MININVIRKVDKYVGPLICSFLLMLNSFYKFIKGVDSALSCRKIKKILLIKFFGIGTIILTSPAIRKLKEEYPQAEITILTLYSNKDICEILPSLDKTIYFKMDNLLASFINFVRIIFSIRKKNFDVIMNLEFLTNFSALATLLTIMFTTTKLSVGFNSPLKWRNNIHDINVSFDHSRHIVNIFFKFVNSICKENNQEISFEKERISFLKNADHDYIEKLLINNSLTNCDYIICVNINSGALSLHRRWPEEYFRIVVCDLIKKPNVAVFLIGSEEDINYVSAFEKKLPSSEQIVNLCGKITIKQLMGLFSKSKFLITNDSGPLHIAVVLELPTVSFFGPETPYLYGPLGPKHHVFYQDLYCSPCLNIYNSKSSYCKDNDCLKLIKPERVLKVIKDKYLFTPAPWKVPC